MEPPEPKPQQTSTGPMNQSQVEQIITEALDDLSRKVTLELVSFVSPEILISPTSMDRTQEKILQEFESTKRRIVDGLKDVPRTVVKSEPSEQPEPKVCFTSFKPKRLLKNQSDSTNHCS